jgi:3-deoxy-D-manno-octulosonate 8-phosphate phosphatase KdsC-like HAD superfamily phosphatase
MANKMQPIGLHRFSEMQIPHIYTDFDGIFSIDMQFSENGKNQKTMFFGARHALEFLASNGAEITILTGDSSQTGRQITQKFLSKFNPSPNVYFCANESKLDWLLSNAEPGSIYIGDDFYDAAIVTSGLFICYTPENSILYSILQNGEFSTKAFTFKNLPELALRIVKTYKCISAPDALTSHSPISFSNAVYMYYHVHLSNELNPTVIVHYDSSQDVENVLTSIKHIVNARLGDSVFVRNTCTESFDSVHYGNVHVFVNGAKYNISERLKNDLNCAESVSLCEHSCTQIHVLTDEQYIEKLFDLSYNNANMHLYVYATSNQLCTLINNKAKAFMQTHIKCQLLR